MAEECRGLHTSDVGSTERENSLGKMRSAKGGVQRAESVHRLQGFQLLSCGHKKEGTE